MSWKAMMVKTHGKFEYKILIKMTVIFNSNIFTHFSKHQHKSSSNDGHEKRYDKLMNQLFIGESNNATFVSLVMILLSKQIQNANRKFNGKQ